jgi:pyruvate,water dikinase
MARFTRWFDEIDLGDLALVGGKTASLGEMYRALRSSGINVPNGFAITADAYRAILETGGLRGRLVDLFAGLDKRRDVADLAERGRRARALVRDAGVPAPVWTEIETAYRRMCDEYGRDVDVAVRSSATAEDLPTASFAGQQESFLNIRGLTALRDAVSHCFASLFTDRAISYRIDQGFGQLEVALSIAVQKMVRSDLACSGVMFTLDTETGFRDVVAIEAAWGLGENVVKGAVDPDEITVFKPTLRAGKRPILQRRVGDKHLRLVYAQGVSGQTTRNEPVGEIDRRRLCLTDDEILTLARWAMIIEDHYSRQANEPRPMDIEWAKDGRTGQLFIVQARPETVESRRDTSAAQTFVLEGRGEELAVGRSVGRKIASGPARLVRDVGQLQAVKPGEVLVAETTTPDWEPVMKRAAAIVTDRGGRTCHAAIVARELGIPAVVGTVDGTRRIPDGATVTVSCAGGDAGRVFKGALPFRVDRIDLAELPATRTRLEMNVGDPEQAFSLAAIPNDGVGLARMEFIITNAIRIHPMALLHPERLDAAARRAVESLTAGYADKAAYFVDRLAEGIAMIAAAFYPKPVVVRLSDFKSNEYASLIGGTAFELGEENPMIGLRGASRYTHPSYAEAFALECKALARVRGEMGLENVRVMVPFCRRVEEGERVLEAMANHGLRRGENGLEVYVMCEIPNNVVRIDAFCRIFDGISIGSNDLTQLTLGVDRDSELVAFDFDERDPGVLEMLRLAVAGARRNRRHVSICGQAPSDYPEIAQLLVRMGIDALSLNPDSVIATRLRVAETERALGVQPQPAREPGIGRARGLGSMVVATDFSPAARDAVARALQLPLQTGASVELLHVMPDERDAVTAAKLELSATRQLEGTRDQARAAFAKGTDIHATLVRGLPFPSIAERAHHGRAELVVVGRHGERRLRELLIGSTAERVIRNGTTSVLVVGARPAGPYRRPLVAIDMSPSSRYALELAAQICDPSLDAIDVIHVIDLPGRLYASEGQLVPALERRLPELEQTIRAELTQFLGEVTASVRWNLTVEIGDPRSAILDQARRRNSDLIAVGTKGRTGLARVFVGSVAEGVIRHAPCDVLVARLP